MEKNLSSIIVKSLSKGLETRFQNLEKMSAENEAQFTGFFYHAFAACIRARPSVPEKVYNFHCFDVG